MPLSPALKLIDAKSNVVSIPRRSRIRARLTPTQLIAELEKHGVSPATLQNEREELTRRRPDGLAELLVRRRGRRRDEIRAQLVYMAMIFAAEGGRKRTRKRDGSPGAHIHAVAGRVALEVGFKHELKSEIKKLTRGYLAAEPALQRLAGLAQARVKEFVPKALLVAAGGRAGLVALHRIAEGVHRAVVVINGAVTALGGARLQLDKIRQIERD